MAINKTTKYTIDPNTIPVNTSSGSQSLSSALDNRVVHVDNIEQLSNFSSIVGDGQIFAVKNEGDYYYSSIDDVFYPITRHNEFHRIGSFVGIHQPSVPIFPNDDTDSLNSFVHPSVVKIPGGFGPEGFIYWMGVNPYDDTDDQKENPYIFGSWDGGEWLVPSGVTNPLVPSPGTADDHLSDPCLLYHNNELWYYYRESIVSTTPRQDSIYLMKSSDGATWSAPVKCDIQNGELILSPAVIYDGTQFIMYSLRRTSEVERRTSADGVNWSAGQDVTINGLVRWSPWHMHAIICNDRYEMLLLTRPGTEDGELVFLTSDDGLTFVRQNTLIQRRYPFEGGAIYHGCLVPEDSDRSSTYEIWYSSRGAGRWTVAHVAATLSRDGLVPVYGHSPSAVFGSVTAGAGHFSSLTTRDNFANIAALISDRASITGGTKSRRVLIAGSGVASGSNSAVLASSNSEATGVNSAAISASNAQASGTQSIVMAGNGGRAEGSSSAVIASDSKAMGSYSAVMASSGSLTEARSPRSLILASRDCVAETPSSSGASIISSSNVLNNREFTFALGYSTSAPSDANQTIRMESFTGTIRASNQTIGGLDYAELFPNGTGVEIEPGTLVTLSGNSVIPATAGDRIFGVVSHTYGILGGDTFSCWQGRYLKDEWGRDVLEEVPDPENPERMITVRKENPDYDHSQAYLPRTERRDEWTTVGILGQVLVRVSDTVSVGDSISAKSGVGVPSSNLTGVVCMKIESDYDESRGYAIAKCLINIQV